VPWAFVPSHEEPAAKTTCRGYPLEKPYRKIRPAILRFFHLFSSETFHFDSASCASKELEKPQLQKTEVAVRLLIGGLAQGFGGLRFSVAA
jgi:hypothetical protein